MSGLHPNIAVGDVHIPYNWTYANAAARTGATGFAAADVGKIARQTDNNTLWMLTATTPTWVQIGGPSPWVQLVDESGASFANWTGVTGTWSSDGSVIKQTNTGATVQRAKYNTMVPAVMTIYQMELQTRTSGTERQFGFAVYDGTNTGGLSIKLREQNDIQVERDSLSVITNISVNIDINTWYTLRVAVAGAGAAIYLDGVFKGSIIFNTIQSGTSYLALLSYQVEAWFRNIKVWTLAGGPT